MVFGRVAWEFDVIQHPKRHAATPTNEMHGQAVVLRVNAYGDGQHAIWCGAQRVGLGAVCDGVVAHGAHGLVFPRLCKAVRSRRF